MNNVMLDIETLGVTPGSVVLSIGAVEFDQSNLGDVFHMGISVQDSTINGLHVDAGTAVWWLGQDQDAQAAILKMLEGALPLDQVLDKFAKSFKDWGKKKLWCNGASFDIPILVAAHKAVGKIQPWKYYNEMDMRTVKAGVGKKVWDENKEAPTVAHDGLADAISQARTLQKVLKAQGISSWLK